MKILHTADWHLDAPMAGLGEENAQELRRQMRKLPEKITRLCMAENCDLLIIAGDLFDSGVVPPRTLQHVFDLMRDAKDVLFFYLRGNHDTLCMSPNAENIVVVPQDGQWLYEDLDGVTIALCDMAQDDEGYPARLKLKEDRFNIAVLHGTITSSGKSRGQTIALCDFAGKNIDYLALGHYHSFQTDALDGRGVYCYSGCLQGRGFDECGQKGFVLLDIDQKSFRQEFIPFASRLLHRVSVNLTGCTAFAQVEARVLEAVAPISNGDMVYVSLTGECPVELNRDTDYLTRLLQGRFFAARLQDQTTVLIDPQSYADDLSFKGAFVQQVLQSDLPQEEKQQVLSLGLHMILGGEVNV